MTNPELCPRCGQPNHCAQSGHAQPVKDCWCFHQPLPPGALDELPAAPLDQACLCPNCLQALRERAKPA